MNFTLDEYRSLIETAVAVGYEPSSFGGEAHDDGSYRILVRHDIDYDPVMISPMAAVESETGVRATYCLQVDSPWYRIDEEPNATAVADALGRGHWLGLHFDATGIHRDGEVAERVGDAVGRLEALFGTQVHAVSFHMPGRRAVGHIQLPEPVVNTYAPRFFEDIGYISDSNQDWRGVDPFEVLRDRVHRRLQMLVHPFWWRTSPQPMRDKMRDLAGRLGIPMEAIVTPEQWSLMR